MKQIFFYLITLFTSIIITSCNEENEPIIPQEKSNFYITEIHTTYPELPSDYQLFEYDSINRISSYIYNIDGCLGNVNYTYLNKQNIILINTENTFLYTKTKTIYSDTLYLESGKVKEIHGLMDDKQRYDVLFSYNSNNELTKVEWVNYFSKNTIGKSQSHFNTYEWENGNIKKIILQDAYSNNHWKSMSLHYDNQIVTGKYDFHSCYNLQQQYRPLQNYQLFGVLSQNLPSIIYYNSSKSTAPENSSYKKFHYNYTEDYMLSIKAYYFSNDTCYSETLTTYKWKNNI
ncbi:MAG: hypothetical protein IKJ52_12210 [Muribaculaceae bacterium]|nr:hypothetical protein [Muribaculaceae bacterium]